MTTYAEDLVAARRNGTPLTLRHGQAPATLADAYWVQTEVVRLLGASVAGWKVGFAADGTAFAAPMLAADFRTSGGVWALGGMAPKIELELAVRLGRDLPVRSGNPYSRAEIIDAIGELVVGIEFVLSRLAGADAPFEARVADNFSNGGYVPGASRKGAAGFDVTATHCRLLVEGALREEAKASHPQGDPLAPVIAYANSQIGHLGGLRAGQIVTTGTLSRPFAVTAATRLDGEIEGIGRVSVQVVA